MKLKEKIKNFVLSQDEEIIVNNRKLIKIELPSGNLLAVYEKDNRDEFDSLSTTATKFAFIVNPETGDIIYTNAEYISGYSDIMKYLEDASEIDARKMQEILKNIKITMADFIFEKMQTLESEVLKKIDLETYAKEAETRYKRKEKLENPFRVSYYKLTPTMIDDFFNNQEELKNKSISQISESDFKLYEKYVGIKYAMLEYEKSLSADPISQRKKAICDVINDERYKTITINYRLPNDSLLSEKINKTRTKNSNAKKTIIDDGHIVNIPIVSIESITWNKQMLYDASQFTPLSLTDEDIKYEFARCGSAEDLTEKDRNNPSLMKRILSHDIVLFKYLGNDLSKDKKFLLDLASTLESKDILSLYCDISLELKKDTAFIHDFFLCVKEQLKPNSYYDYRFQNFTRQLKIDIHDKLFTNTALARLLIEKVSIADKELMEEFPDHLWEDSAVIESLSKKIKTEKESELLIKKIATPITCQKIFTLEQIQQNINNLHDDIKEYRDFIKYIVENMGKENKLLQKNNSLLTNYAYDTEMVNLFAEKVCDQYAAKYIVEAVMPAYDSLKMFNLVNKNILFYNYLSAEDKSIFLDGELFDINDLTFEISKNEIFITAPNSNYRLTPSSVSLEDENKHSIRTSVYTSNNIAAKLDSILEQRYPEVAGLTLTTKISNLCKNCIVKTTEEIDR